VAFCISHSQGGFVQQIDPDVPPLHEPLAQLERSLIETYLLDRGHDPHVLHTRRDPQAFAILAEAAQYATLRLAELESRAHLVNEIHGARVDAHPKHDIRGEK
jgi:hypothetical protein